MGKEVLTLIADWCIDIVRGKKYGVCRVQAPPEWPELSYRRGFPLTRPTHVRCALFAVNMAVELVCNCKRLEDRKADTVVAIVTHNRVVGDIVKKHDAGEVGHKNNGRAVLGFNECFMQSFDRNLLSARGVIDLEVVYIPEDFTSGKKDLLMEKAVHLDIDPETDYPESSKQLGDNAEDIATGDAKLRDLKRLQLLQMTGARGTLPTKKLSKKQRARIAMAEGHVPQEEEGGGNNSELQLQLMTEARGALPRRRLSKKQRAKLARAEKQRCAQGNKKESEPVNGNKGTQSVPLPAPVETVQEERNVSTIHPELAAAIAAELARQGGAGGLRPEIGGDGVAPDGNEHGAHREELPVP